ncbi:hypothetical protein [Geodermatophilus sp. URMC 62]|uniref:hypothetical protein n=1 Tax=Geodermatophilus sp. URMC 62 TaxID=3423414 RepID=UPI00406C3F3A
MEMSKWQGPTVGGARRVRHVTDAEVLGAVAAALSLAGSGDDWAVLEAWVSALTAVNRAAVELVPGDLRELL